MEICEQRILIPSRFNEWRLHFLGDLHVGSAAFEEQAFLDKVEEVKADDHAWWIGMGDYIDAISYRDPRYDPKDQAKGSDQDQIFNWQANRFLEMVRPIRGKCLGMVCGNHEESVRLHHQFDIAASMASHLGVTDLRYAAAIRIAVCDPKLSPSHKDRTMPQARYMVNVYVHHGWGGGRKEGGKINKAAHDIWEQAPVNTDICAMGHVHASIPGMKAGWYLADRGQPCLIPKHRVWVITGTYRGSGFEGGTTYSERKGYPPVVIGSPHIKIRQIMTKVRSMRGGTVERAVTTYQTIGP